MTLLEMRGITKTFPGVRALDGVSFDLQAGEIHALVGENGAGKSTLMKILAGVYPHGTYEGEVLVDGEPRHFKRVTDAAHAGIAVVHQELSLVRELSIAENIFLGREPRRFGVIRSEELYSRAASVLEELHLTMDAHVPVGYLGIGQQHLVEIAKALTTFSGTPASSPAGPRASRARVLRGGEDAAWPAGGTPAFQPARILVLDEPTAALTESETEILFAILERLRERGAGIVYISHKLDEVFRLSNRTTVLRDGRCVGTEPTSALDKARVIARMVGRDIGDVFPVAERAPSEVVFEARGVTVEDPNVPGKLLVDDVSFEVRRGEVLGVAGLVGAGRSDLLMALFGAHPGTKRGEIFVAGKPVSVRHPWDAIAQGIAFVTEDRKRFGLLLDQSLVHNMTLASLRLTNRVLTDDDAETAAGERAMKDLRIKAPSVLVQVETLSGGNQQKTVLAKWLMTGPKVLFLDEPTRGIDVGAKQEIYAQINRLASEGLGIVLVSSELPEVLALSDRVLVLHEGRVTGHFKRGEATAEAVMHCATGEAVSV